ncbi:MAG: histidine kinase [Lachnospiraceae bacterium]|nr:histidine kinase [Lachnospiraceae bacterium]
MSKFNRSNLKRSFGRLLFAIWFVPLLCMTLILVALMYNRNISLIDENIRATTDKSVDLFMRQIEDIETASKSASYYSDIRNSYMQYKKNGYYSSLSNSINSFLAKLYKFNSNCKEAYLAFVTEPDNVFYTCNYSTGGKYKDVIYFRDNINKLTVEEYSPILDTGNSLYYDNNHIYLIRNLMNTDFKPFAVLTLEIDADSLMQNLEGVYGCESVNVFYDGKLMLSSPGGKLIADPSIFNKLARKECKVFTDNGRYAACKVEYNHHVYGFLVKVKDTVITDSIKSILLIVLCMMAFMVPFIIIAEAFFKKNITNPVADMVYGYDRIKNRDYGYEISANGSSEEILYMQDSFNHMSRTLKEQFDKIYSEEIALRDAKIMALQSQINPHFLNNTLEIINWEARLNENYKVSSMIEALSTMLEATMNRKNEQMISIREEMAYVDAYLYIIAQRLGDSFECIKDIDEELLDEKIPRLIIQPIVENAVDHGIELARSARIEIHLYQENSLIHIDIINNSKLKEEDREKINHLLYDDIDESKERRVSLGIRNVDKRIRLIYGEDCGLFIYNNDKEETVSTILLKKYFIQ